MALLFAAGCATTRPGEEEQSSGDRTVEIGYGTVDEDQLTGSVGVVRGEDLKGTPTRTLSQMLSRLPGVQVAEREGGQFSVRIRGTNSFLASEEPLWVLDGVVLQGGVGGLNGLNSSNIQSITVLKDAGETAIYGSRGANGVILIKTKRQSG